jgi:hypothetical protein
MVAYLQPLCNCLPTCPPAVRCEPAAALRRPWDHPRWVARIWRRLDLVRPLVHTPSSPYTPGLPNAALCSTHLVDPPGSQRVPSPRPAQPASAACSRPRRAGYLKAPECSAAGVLEARCVRHAFCCTYGRRPRVPTGDAPVYLRETPPCTYGRRPRVPAGDAPVYLRETPPCTCGRRPVYLRETPRVPAGDAPCTCGRRPVYLRETKYNLTHYF